MRNEFYMSRDWFNVAHAYKDNELRKTREKINNIEEENVRERQSCLWQMMTYRKI